MKTSQGLGHPHRGSGCIDWWGVDTGISHSLSGWAHGQPGLGTLVCGEPSHSSSGKTLFLWYPSSSSFLRQNPSPSSGFSWATVPSLFVPFFTKAKEKYTHSAACPCLDACCGLRAAPGKICSWSSQTTLWVLMDRVICFSSSLSCLRHFTLLDVLFSLEFLVFASSAASWNLFSISFNLQARTSQALIPGADSRGDDS